MILQTLKVRHRKNIIRVPPGKYLSDVKDFSNFISLEKEATGLVLEEINDKSSQDSLSLLRVLVDNKLFFVWVNKQYECI